MFSIEASYKHATELRCISPVVTAHDTVAARLNALTKSWQKGHSPISLCHLIGVEK